jgi:uncharacterized protein YcbK (DUF882 family)
MIEIISLTDYWMGRDETHSDELTSQIQGNASDLLILINQLLIRLDISTVVNSGWRPKDVNKSIGGAPNSYHTTGEAIDLKDTRGRIAYKIIQNHDLLSQLGLWLEWPQATKGWVHLDIGKRSARKINTFLP